jgi:Mg2+ and Co2+ transporter CorA
MNEYAKVEGHLNLVRDLNSNAIINTDEIESIHYNKLKKRKEQQLERIDTIESELSELKSSINEIKELLKGVVNES